MTAEDALALNSRQVISNHHANSYVTSMSHGPYFTKCISISIHYADNAWERKGGRQPVDLFDIVRFILSRWYRFMYATACDGYIDESRAGLSKCFIKICYYPNCLMVYSLAAVMRVILGYYEVQCGLVIWQWWSYDALWYVLHGHHDEKCTEIFTNVDHYTVSRKRIRHIEYMVIVWPVKHFRRNPEHEHLIH